MLVHVVHGFRRMFNKAKHVLQFDWCFFDISFFCFFDISFFFFENVDFVG
jgi:hypothetical protein